MKIWAKTIIEDKITRNYLYETDSYESLEKSMTEMCEKLDIPTPIVTATNERYFTEFNHVKFRPSDFVERIDFEFMEIEFVKDTKRK